MWVPQKDQELYNQAVNFHKQEKYTLALKKYLEFQSKYPGYHPLYVNLGHLAYKEKNYALALKYFSQALTLKNNDELALANMAKIHTKLNDLNAAANYYKKLIKINGHADYYFAYANCLRLNLKCHQALIWFKKGLKINPDNHNVKINAGHCALLKGNYQEGWNYLKSWQEVRPSLQSTYKKPLWEGSNLAGKTLLVLAEHRPGDIIFWARYIEKLKKFNYGKIFIQVQPELLNLFKYLKGNFSLIAKKETISEISEYDCYCAFGDLPGLFKTNRKTIPTSVPYFKDFPANNTFQNKIGLFWRGKAESTEQKNRTCALKNLRPYLAKFPKNTFISLQIEHSKEEKKLLTDLSISTPLSKKDDYYKSGQIIKSLKAVISIDTSIANLSGALGVPLFILLKYSPDWRWYNLAEPTISPWYPTAKLYKQTVPGNWDNALEKLFKDLPINVNIPKC